MTTMAARKVASEVIEATASSAARKIHPDPTPERSRFDEERDSDEGDDDQSAAGDEHIAEMVSGRTRPHGLLVGFGHDRPFVDITHGNAPVLATVVAIRASKPFAAPVTVG
jgi:hypothetical protein